MLAAVRVALPFLTATKAVHARLFNGDTTTTLQVCRDAPAWGQAEARALLDWGPSQYYKSFFAKMPLRMS